MLRGWKCRSNGLTKTGYCQVISKQHKLGKSKFRNPETRSRLDGGYKRHRAQIEKETHNGFKYTHKLRSKLKRDIKAQQ